MKVLLFVFSALMITSQVQAKKGKLPCAGAAEKMAFNVLYWDEVLKNEKQVKSAQSELIQSLSDTTQDDFFYDCELEEKGGKKFHFITIHMKKIGPKGKCSFISSENYQYIEKGI